MEESLCGQLLLASPALMDPNFRRAVILVSVHSEEGAMGVVLNRPSEVTVSEAVPQLEQTVAEREPVYVGGPMQPSSIVFLAEFLDPTLAGLLVLGRIGFPAPDAGIEELTEATARRRVFAGYAGWGEGQLDAELDQGDWIAHNSAVPDDVFCEAPEDLWSSVLTRMGGSYALIARMPSDPSVN
jgi:putative transcriptional regulator